MKATRLIITITALGFLLSCLAYAKELPGASPRDVGMSAARLARIKPAVQAQGGHGEQKTEHTRKILISN